MVRGVAHSYPPLNLQVGTPRVVLAGATDDLLERLTAWRSWACDPRPAARQ